jgi:hypothetical protein
MKGWKIYVLYYTFCILGIISIFFIDNKNFTWLILCIIFMGPTFYVFEKLRGEDNIFIYYLIKGPLFMMSLLLICLWFFFPVFYYFSEPSSIYYTFCLKLLGGELGEFIWIVIYFFGWGYLGWKIVTKTEKGIMNIINKLKKRF